MESFDPRIRSLVPFAPRAYADLVAAQAFTAEQVSEEAYSRAVDRLQRADDVKVSRLIYESDGLAVTGVAALPAEVTPGGHPILIYNRGGNGNFGILTAGQINFYLSTYARRGYLAFGSNYRGNDGGEGAEDFGGEDVNDVLTLLDISRRHPGWDGKNAFMLGSSRGGMMTYLAIRRGAALNAAATIAGLTDLWMSAAERPAMEQNVYAVRIPHYRDSPEEARFSRSATRWPEALHVPLLLLHGTNDTRVGSAQGEALAAALASAGQPHKLVLYEGDDHSLSRNRLSSVTEITQWFERHRIG